MMCWQVNSTMFIFFLFYLIESKSSRQIISLCQTLGDLDTIHMHFSIYQWNTFKKSVLLQWNQVKDFYFKIFSRRDHRCSLRLTAVINQSNQTRLNNWRQRSDEVIIDLGHRCESNTVFFRRKEVYDLIVFRTSNIIDASDTALFHSAKQPLVDQYNCPL